MKKIVCVLLIVLLVGCNSTSKETPDIKKFADDVNQLVDIIIAEELLISDIDILEKRRKEALLKIEENMSERDFYLVLLPIVNCGRVLLTYPQETMERLKNETVYIPIKIQTSNDKMYLIEDKTGTLPLGSEITSINNYPIEKIMETIYMRIPIMDKFLGIPLTEENKRILQSQLDMTFSGNLLFILDSTEYEITLNHNGQLKKYIVPAINLSELNTWLFPEVDEKAPDGTFVGKDNSIKKALTNTGFVVKCYKKLLE